MISNQIQPPFSRPSSIAINANAADDQRVAVELELVLRRHFADGCFDVGMLKFDQPLALLAKQVLVLRIAVVVIVISVRAEFEFAEQAGVDEFRQGAIHSGPADVEPGRLQVANQLFRRKVMVLGEYMMNEVPLLAREPLRPGPAAEVFPEFVFRRLRDVNSR